MPHSNFYPVGTAVAADFELELRKTLTQYSDPASKLYENLMNAKFRLVSFFCSEVYCFSRA